MVFRTLIKLINLLHQIACFKFILKIQPVLLSWKIKVFKDKIEVSPGLLCYIICNDASVTNVPHMIIIWCSFHMIIIWKSYYIYHMIVIWLSYDSHMLILAWKHDIHMFVKNMIIIWCSIYMIIIWCKPYDSHVWHICLCSQLGISWYMLVFFVYV